tara:strand:- start:83 stop:238 length:156 start_codon:yes stop_codon:yes gene_type:complete
VVLKDVSWMRVGASQLVGESERDTYEASYDAAGFTMRWEEAPGCWRATRTA